MPIEVTDSGITIDFNEVHLANAFSPILITELGIASNVSAEHPLNAYLPIEVTESGIVMWDSDVQFENMPSTDVSELGILISESE